MATSGSKGFWRKNSSAIPGRINLQRISSSSDADETIPSKSSSSSSGTAATNCVNVANSSTTSTANSHSSGEIMPQPHNKASTSFKDFEKSSRMPGTLVTWKTLRSLGRPKWWKLPSVISLRTKLEQTWTRLWRQQIQSPALHSTVHQSLRRSSLNFRQAITVNMPKLKH